MPAKGKKKKPGRKAAKEKPSSMHDRSRLLGQGNETLRLGQTSDHATEKHKPQDFIASLRKKGELDSIRISVRDVGSRVVLTPGVYARGPASTPPNIHPGMLAGKDAAAAGDGAGPAVQTDIGAETAWRTTLSPAHRAVMAALDHSGVSRMLDVRPTYICPVHTCHFHCHSKPDLLEHFRNEHVTKKSLLQSVTATTAAVEGSIAKLSTDSLRTKLGVTKLPVPDPISLGLDGDGDGVHDGGDRNQAPGPCELTVDDDGVIVLSIPPPPEGVEPGSAEDTVFNEGMDWLFLEWSQKSWNDNPKSSMGAVKSDNEDGFERWISCNHRLIYHYDHYVTARENVFLPCTIRGVRLMKDGQKVSLVVPEVMRPMKPKHVKSNASWKLQREHPEVTLESHNDDVIGEDCFTFRCAKFRSYQGTGKMARSPAVMIGGVPWRLMVYPDGNSAQDQGEFTSVFLEVDKSHDTSSCWQCFVHFKLDILSSKAKHTYEKKAAHRFTSTSMNWGFGQLMSLAEVLDAEKGYLAADGSVTFRATVRVVEGTDIEQWGGHTTYDSIKKTGMPGLPYWDGVDSPSCLRSLLQILFYIPRVRQAVFGMKISHSDEMARPLVGLQLVFYWLHMVNDPNCSPARKDALKQAGSQLKEIMQGCSGWDALKKFPGWEPVTQSDLRLLIQVLLASIDEQLQTTDSPALMSNLFRGVKRSFVKCTDVDEESSEIEGFCEIELNAKESADGTKDLMTAFRELTEPSIPIKYMTKGHGYQTARAGVTFVRFPPILVVQLTRFEDHAVRDGEKIKDRCEFPEHINLDEFLEQPEETPADYTLHAMLVHYDSKDVISRTLHHGQHAAFIRPDPVKGEWYKFMDPFVKKAAATEDVLEEAFGESGEFCGQAYMLVYMRDSWAGELLQPVDEIPESNLERLPQLLEKSPWSTDIADPKDVLDDDWMEVEVVRQCDIASYSGVDICTFTETALGTLFKVQKSDSVNELVKKIKERFDCDTEPCLFQFIHRQNGSYRPDEYLDTSNGMGAKPIHECASSCSKYSQSKERWHLFLLDPSLYSPDRDNFLGTGSHFLLFYKLYDAEAGNGSPVIRHVAHTLVAYNETINDLMPKAPDFLAGGELEGAQLDCFEEVSNTLVEDVQANKTCRQQELQNGDILVICRRGTHTIHQLDVSYAQVRNQVTIEFREFSRPHERGFTMALDKTLEYNEVAHAVAEYLDLDDPLNLQFASLALSHDRPGAVGRTIPPPCDNQTLEDMRHFAARTVSCQCHKKASQILLYEVLPVQVTERLLQLTRDRESWLNIDPPMRVPPSLAGNADARLFSSHQHGVLRDLLKDMRQLAEAIRKDVRERLADIERDAVNLATKIRALKEDQTFVRKQLASLDEQESTSSSKRARDVRKRLKEAREQRDYVEQTKGTRDQFERDLTGLFHNYQCQVSQMVAREPLKMFLVDLEQDLDRVVGKIWKLLWGGGLTRERMDALVQDKAFQVYFEWQAEYMLHHAKMVKRKVLERAEIFAEVCEKARVDPLTQGIKAVFRYHLCGRAVKDQEDRERSAQRKVDAEVDLVQQELLQMEEDEKAKKQAAAERERQKQEERLSKENKRREEEQKKHQQEEEAERKAAVEKKRAEELESARREEDLKKRRATEQEKQRQEEERNATAKLKARKQKEEREKQDAKKRKDEEKVRKRKEEEDEVERQRKAQEAARQAEASAARQAAALKARQEKEAAAAKQKEEKQAQKKLTKKEKQRAKKEAAAAAAKAAVEAAAASKAQQAAEAAASADATAAAAAAAESSGASSVQQHQASSQQGSAASSLGGSLPGSAPLSGQNTPPTSLDAHGANTLSSVSVDMEAHMWETIDMPRQGGIPRSPQGLGGGSPPMGQQLSAAGPGGVYPNGQQQQMQQQQQQQHRRNFYGDMGEQPPPPQHQQLHPQQLQPQQDVMWANQMAAQQQQMAAAQQQQQQQQVVVQQQQQQQQDPMMWGAQGGPVSQQMHPMGPHGGGHNSHPQMGGGMDLQDPQSFGHGLGGLHDAPLGGGGHATQTQDEMMWAQMHGGGAGGVAGVGGAGVGSGGAGPSGAGGALPAPQQGLGPGSSGNVGGVGVGGSQAGPQAQPSAFGDGYGDGGMQPVSNLLGGLNMDDEDDGADIWAAIGQEQAAFQDDLSTTSNTFNVGGGYGGSGSIW